MTAASTAPARPAVPAGRVLADAREQRQRAAAAWRADHVDDADRERLWRAYRVGALWMVAQPLRDHVRAALYRAETAVPFGDRTAL